MVIMLPLLFLVSCNEEKFTKSRSDFDYIEVNNDVEGITEIENFIKPYRDSVENKLDRVLSYSKSELWANRKGKFPESPLGNLLSDLVLEQANERYNANFSENIDFAVLNRGGIRTSLGIGDLTLREMFEIMPFNNTLLVVTLGPKNMKGLIEYMENSKGHPMANIKMTINKNKAENITIGGAKYDETKNYKVVTTDYLQHGGDRMYFFNDPVAIDTLHYLMRDAMIDYFEKTDTVEVELDGRFNYAK